MRSHYRAIAFAIFVSSATLAGAQSGGTANPVARSPDGEITFYNPWAAQQRGLSSSAAACSTTPASARHPRSVQPVTPVPEPSQWR
jgi:hypothetical protein